MAKKSIDPQKLQTVQKLETMFKESKTIAISSLHKVRSTQLMSLRKSFRNDLTILVVKNNLAKIALSKSDISSDYIHVIQEEVKKLTGEIPLVISSFSEEGLEELMQILFDKCDQYND